MTDPPKKLRRRWRRWVVRLTLAAIVSPFLYIAAALVGTIAVNRDFQQAADDGVTIFVVDNGVHTDLALPVVADDHDWRDTLTAAPFGRRLPTAAYLLFGWGDRRFYLETPTWDDLQASVLIQANFWPTPSVLHVAAINEPSESPRLRKLTISSDQYRALIDEIETTFAKPHGDDGPVEIEDAAYGNRDAFFEAEGAYHLFNTCNCWTGRTLRRSGVRVGWWTPLPQSVMWSIP